MLIVALTFILDQTKGGVEPYEIVAVLGSATFLIRQRILHASRFRWLGRGKGRHEPGEVDGGGYARQAEALVLDLPAVLCARSQI
jgi:hypothetical protein